MSNVILDFDGTIADTFTVVVDIFYHLTKRGEPLPKGEVERLRGMTLIHVVSELRIPYWRIPFLLMRGRRIMKSRLGTIELIQGMDSVLQQLQEDGHNLYVISSNGADNINLFLAAHKLESRFKAVYGGVSLLGKSKAIRRVMQRNRLDPADTFYVGDEARDIESAHKAGVKPIAVTWGYNNAHILKAHNPYALAFLPEEIITAVIGKQAIDATP